jgi:hypothetical protein
LCFVFHACLGSSIASMYSCSITFTSETVYQLFHAFALAPTPRESSFSDILEA